MKKAFTMAEILLSLTIIGVVAAITNMQDSYNGYYWSSTLNSDNNAWLLAFNNSLTRIYNPRTSRFGIWCVKR